MKVFGRDVVGPETDVRGFTRAPMVWSRVTTGTEICSCTLLGPEFGGVDVRGGFDCGRRNKGGCYGYQYWRTIQIILQSKTKPLPASKGRWHRVRGFKPGTFASYCTSRV